MVDGKTDIVEGGAIGDESSGGPMSIMDDEYKLVQIEVE